MNILQLYEDHNVAYETEGHKHCRPGWINTPCPFCTGNPGLHLGYNLEEDYFYCWRCGWHSLVKTLSKLIGTNERETKQIIRQYGGRSRQIKQPKVTIRRKAHTLPSGITPLADRHKQYLARRGFDPDRLEREWGLIATGPISKLDGIDYKHRIIAPIYWDGEQVSFQGRDFTDRHLLKYMTCPKDRELVHHKHILYGRQERWIEIGICVEGITDVWKLGPLSFATFGIEYTRHQIQAITKRFERIAVVFDPDPQAKTQANKLVSELRFRGVDAWRVETIIDPGSMSQDDADHLVNSIIL